MFRIFPQATGRWAGVTSMEPEQPWSQGWTGMGPKKLARMCQQRSTSLNQQRLSPGDEGSTQVHLQESEALLPLPGLAHHTDLRREGGLDRVPEANTAPQGPGTQGPPEGAVSPTRLPETSRPRGGGTGAGRPDKPPGEADASSSLRSTLL